MSGSWYKRDVADGYTSATPTNLVNNSLNPGIYVPNKNVNIHSDVSSGRWDNANYTFNKKDGVLKVFDGDILNNPYSGLSPHINLKDIKKINISSDVHLSDGLDAFSLLPNMTEINLSGLDTKYMNSTVNMFRDDPNLKDIIFGNGFNTDNVTSMDYMFESDKSLKQINFDSNFNTNKVTDMSWMFGNDTQLTSLDLSNFNTSQVTNMNSMFYNDKSLKSLNLGNNFNTNKVTDMDWMFGSDAQLTSLDLSNFNTNQVTGMRSMFFRDKLLEKLDLGSHFDTSNVTDMSYMFQLDSGLSDLNLGSFNTHRVSNMSDMLTGMTGLKRIELGSDTYLNRSTKLPSSLWYKRLNSSNYTSLDPTNIIDNNISKGIYVTNFNVSPAQISDLDVKGMWGSAPYTFNPVTGLLKTTGSGVITPIKKIIGNNSGQIKDPTKIRSIQFASGTSAPSDSSDLFSSSVLSKYTSDGITYYSNLNRLSDIDCQNLSTNQVTNMDNMFHYDTGLKSIDLRGFNTNNVEYMGYMFQSDYQLKALDLSSFNTYQVSGMHHMFQSDYSLTNLILGSNFDIKDITDTSGMFQSDRSLTDLNLGGKFDMSHDLLANNMFKDDHSLKSLDLGDNFNTKNMCEASNMFSSDENLTSLDLGPKFTLSSANKISGMFSDDTSLKTLNLGKNFDAMRVVSDKDLFSNDISLNTISGDSFKLNSSANLPSVSGQDWFVQGNNNQPVGNSVDITDGNSHSGTYILCTSNPVDTTKLEFMDDSNNIGNLIIKGYAGTPIPYGIIKNSLVNGYSPNIPVMKLIKTIPNSPYKYINGGIQVPVRHNGQSNGSANISVSYIMLQGKITLNFHDYKNDLIKAIVIPYQINNVPIGSNVNNLLTYGNPGGANPNDYLNKVIQSFQTKGYSYQKAHSSSSDEYLNVPVTVSDGFNKVLNGYINGNPVTHNLTFNFHSNKINEHILYKYNSTVEGSDDVQGDPGADGNVNNVPGLKSGFVLSPGAKTSFKFNHSTVVIPVQPEEVRVPFKIKNSDDQVIPGLSDLTSNNQLPVNGSDHIQLEPSDISKLRNDWYQLDNDQNVKVLSSNVNHHKYNGNVLVLHAHKININVPIKFIYHNQQKGNTTLVKTMKSTINSAELTPSVPFGYEITNNGFNYNVTKASEVAGKYETDPVNVPVQPVTTTNYIKYMDNNSQIGHSYKVNGYDGRAGLGHDTFVIDSPHPIGLINGYHVNNKQIIHLNNGNDSVIKVQVSPDTMQVPFKVIASDGTKILSDRSNNKLSVNTKGNLIENNLSNQLSNNGYQLSSADELNNFVIKPSDVDSNGNFIFSKEPAFKVDKLNSVKVPIQFMDNNRKVGPVINGLTGHLNKSVNILSFLNNKIVAGYQLVSEQNNDSNYKIKKDNLVNSTNNNVVDVQIKPLTQRDTIIYISNGAQKGNSQKISGPDSRTGIKGSSVKVGANSKGLPQGYHVDNVNQRIPYDGGTHAIEIVPDHKDITVNFMNQVHHKVGSKKLSISYGSDLNNHELINDAKSSLQNGYNINPGQSNDHKVNYNSSNINIDVTGKFVSIPVGFFNGNRQIGSTENIRSQVGDTIRIPRIPYGYHAAVGVNNPTQLTAAVTNNLTKIMVTPDNENVLINFKNQDGKCVGKDILNVAYGSRQTSDQLGRDAKSKLETGYTINSGQNGNHTFGKSNSPITVNVTGNQKNNILVKFVTNNGNTQVGNTSWVSGKVGDTVALPSKPSGYRYSSSVTNSYTINNDTSNIIIPLASKPSTEVSVQYMNGDQRIGAPINVGSAREDSKINLAKIASSHVPAGYSMGSNESLDNWAVPSSNLSNPVKFYVTPNHEKINVDLINQNGQKVGTRAVSKLNGTKMSLTNLGKAVTNLPKGYTVVNNQDDSYEFSTLNNSATVKVIGDQITIPVQFIDKHTEDAKNGQILFTKDYKVRVGDTIDIPAKPNNYDYNAVPLSTYTISSKDLDSDHSKIKPIVINVHHANNPRISIPIKLVTPGGTVKAVLNGLTGEKNSVVNILKYVSDNKFAGYHIAHGQDGLLHYPIKSNSVSPVTVRIVPITCHITVQFVSPQGNEGSAIVDGNYSDQETTDQLAQMAISKSSSSLSKGYHVDPNQNDKHMFTTNPLTIRVNVSGDPVKVVVNFINSINNQVVDSKLIHSLVGSTITIPSKPNGYKYDGMHPSVYAINSSNMNKPINIKIVAVHHQPTQVQDTVKFMHGNTVIKSDVYTGNLGTQFNVRNDVPNNYNVINNTIFTYDGKTHMVQLGMSRPNNDHTQPVVKYINDVILFNFKGKTIKTMAPIGKEDSALNVLNEVPTGYVADNTNFVFDGKTHIVHLNVNGPNSNNHTVPVTPIKPKEPAKDVQDVVEFVHGRTVIKSSIYTGKRGTQFDIKNDVPSNYNTVSNTVFTHDGGKHMVQLGINRPSGNQTIPMKTDTFIFKHGSDVIKSVQLNGQQGRQINVNKLVPNQYNSYGNTIFTFDGNSHVIQLGIDRPNNNVIMPVQKDVTDKLIFKYGNSIIKAENKTGQEGLTFNIINDVPKIYHLSSGNIFTYDGKTHIIQLGMKHSGGNHVTKPQNLHHSIINLISNGKMIGTVTVDGINGSTVDVSNYAPKGYKFTTAPRIIIGNNYNLPVVAAPKSSSNNNYIPSYVNSSSNSISADHFNSSSVSNNNGGTIKPSNGNTLSASSNSLPPVYPDNSSENNVNSLASKASSPTSFSSAPSASNHKNISNSISNNDLSSSNHKIVQRSTQTGNSYPGTKQSNKGNHYLSNELTQSSAHNDINDISINNKLDKLPQTNESNNYTLITAIILILFNLSLAGIDIDDHYRRN